MTIVEAALLGLIQALTEFLPVSSSGHLRLAEAFLHVEDASDLLFDILLHVGTLAAVVFVYRRDLARLVVGALQGLEVLLKGQPDALKRHEGLRMAVLLVVATVPTAIIGLLFEDWVESELVSVPLVASLLLLNGAMLWISRRAPSNEDAERDEALSVAGIGLTQALLIGLAQGIAILPGISRSGATIVTALFLGADRMRAAQFSFFLSIPAILGALVLKFEPEALARMDAALPAYAVGTLVAAAFGVLALLGLLRLLRAARFHHFAWYCWALGLAALALTLVG